MCFPEFPFPSDLPSFPGHQDVSKYLQQYANHFDLMRYIKFRTFVEQVKPIPVAVRDHDLVNSIGGEKPRKDGLQWYSDSVKWQVTYTNLDSGQMTSEDFDAVLVCNG